MTDFVAQLVLYTVVLHYMVQKRVSRRECWRLSYILVLSESSEQLSLGRGAVPISVGTT